MEELFCRLSGSLYVVQLDGHFKRIPGSGYCAENLSPPDYSWFWWVLGIVAALILFHMFSDWVGDFEPRGYDDGGSSGRKPDAPVTPVSPDGLRAERERQVQAMADAVIERKGFMERNKVR